MCQTRPTLCGQLDELPNCSRNNTPPSQGEKPTTSGQQPRSRGYMDGGVQQSGARPRERYSFHDDGTHVQPQDRCFKKVPSYDGSSSWHDYLIQFEMIAELNGWTAEMKALQLATSLQGQARGVLCDLEPHQRHSFQHLTSALTTRFEPTNQSEVYSNTTFCFTGDFDFGEIFL